MSTVARGDKCSAGAHDVSLKEPSQNHVWPASRLSATHLHFSADGSRLLIATGGNLEWWSWPLLEPIAVFQAPRGHRNQLRKAAVTADGSLLATTDWGGAVALLSSTTGSVLRVFWPVTQAHEEDDIQIVELRFDERDRLWMLTRQGEVYHLELDSDHPQLTGRIMCSPNQWFNGGCVMPRWRCVLYYPGPKAFAGIYSWLNEEPPLQQHLTRWKGSSLLDIQMSLDLSWLVLSRKSGRTKLVKLNENGQPTDESLLQRHSPSPSPLLKMPQRTIAHAFHPTLPLLVTINVAGDMLRFDTLTGKLVGIERRMFPMGYPTGSCYWHHRLEVSIKPTRLEGRLCIAHRNPEGPGKALMVGDEILGVNGVSVFGLQQLHHSIEAGPRFSDLLIGRRDGREETLRVDLDVSSY